MWQINSAPLTKLSYLLTKPVLSTAEVRSLIGTPLRGELTRPASTLPPSISEPKGIDQNLESIHGVLSQVIRLSSARPIVPKVTVTPSTDDESAKNMAEAAAPWSWTASEAASAEGALFPYLVHLAAARNDIEALKFCLAAEQGLNTDHPSSPTSEFQPRRNIAIGGGLTNCIEPSSGRSPLHSAALNGCVDAVNALLEAGALVHLRDALGHTPLYYAARQEHESVVDILVKAGAMLGGADVERGFTDLAMEKATISRDEHALRIWAKAGRRHRRLDFDRYHKSFR